MILLGTERQRTETNQDPCLCKVLFLGQKHAAVSLTWKNGHKSTASSKLNGYPISKCKQVLEHLHRLEGNTCPTPSQQSFLMSADTPSALPPHVSCKPPLLGDSNMAPVLSHPWLRPLCRSTAHSSPVLMPYLQQSAILWGSQAGTKCWHLLLQWQLWTQHALVLPGEEVREALPPVPYPTGGMQSEHTADPACRPSG